MKRLYITAAAIAALSLAPALAQIPVNEPPTETEAVQPAPAPTAQPTEDGVAVHGVKPSDVLGAIDTSELVDHPKDQAAADPKMPASEEQPAQTASIENLPDEVQDVVEDGKYTTEDLVRAELAAIESSEPATDAS